MPVENKKRDLVVTRVVAAPVGQVWRAWTDPEQVRRWWGPTGFTCPLARMDVREGGTSLVAMRSPEGQDLYNTWTYHRIVPQQRLEFIQNFADQDGNTIAPAGIGAAPGHPQDMHYLVTFNAHGALWTGVVVVVFLQLFPEAKRRQLKGALDAYDAAQREQARTGSDQTPRDNQAPTAR